MPSVQCDVGCCCVMCDHVSAVTRGQCHLVGRAPIIVGLSPGNPFYYKDENLKSLLKFACSSSDQVKLFMPDVISEHNYRAVGSTNPERAARTKANRLKNKVKTAIKSCDIDSGEVSYIDWRVDVETHSDYTEQLEYILQLYQNHDDFKKDIKDTTERALTCLQNGRLKDKNNKEEEEVTPIDLNEGVQYLLKELAFFLAVPALYKGMEKFVFIYHQDWPVLEKLFEGYYDGHCRQSLGFVIRQLCNS